MISETDAQALAALHEAAMAGLGPHWRAEALREMAAQPGCALIHEGAQGFALIRCAGDEAELLALAVAASERRRGLGGALLRRAIAQAKRAGARRLFLEVSEINDAARRLYARFGFQKLGIRRDYYLIDGQRRNAEVLGICDL